MAGLNEYECEMLDAVLEAFGKQDGLTWQQLLDIFGDDEDFALSLIDVLVEYGLVSEAGNVTGRKLPLMINREPKALLFMQSGGFLKRYFETADIREEEPITSVPTRPLYFKYLLVTAALILIAALVFGIYYLLNHYIGR